MFKPSLLTIRILAVNLLTIIILLSGILYVGIYKKELILSGSEDLRMDAETIASFLKSSFIIYDAKKQQYYFDKAPLTKMFKDLGNRTHTRITITNKDQKQLIDNWSFLAPQTQEALKTNQALQKELLLKSLNSENIQQDVWSLSNEADLIFYISLPLFTQEGVFLGTLTLTRENDFNDAIYNARKRILLISLLSFLFTGILSLYLARTITLPITQLAKAAHAIQQNASKKLKIKQLEKRKDEIGMLYRSLADMTDALSNRLDAIESFAADVSHEIKNPLCSIQSAIETIQTIKSEEKRKKLFEIIASDVKRLDRLISDISNASRIDAEMARVEFKRVNVADLLKTLTDLYNVTSQKGDEKLTLKIKCPAAKSFTMGIETRLAQVIQNLIGNALSFAKKNTKIIITLTRKKIKGESFIEIKIDNEGPIIEKKNLKKIFDRFYTDRPQSHQQHPSMPGEHSGLGLSISKQIIEMHKGIIEAKQLKDKNGKPIGSSFIILLRAI